MLPQLRIVATGDSPQARANNRGHLFETLMSDVLRHYGYTIDKKPSVNYAGMEIDIEGHETLSHVPVYAECKCYDTEINSPQLQAFYGKYCARWRKDQRCRGLFIALPRVNSHARGFYKENCEGSGDQTVSLLEEELVLKSIFDAALAVRETVIKDRVDPKLGTPGDQILLYTDHGFIWVQYVMSQGSAVADRYLLFLGDGAPISDSQTLDYLQEVLPDLKGFRHIAHVGSSPVPATIGSYEITDEPIVEVRGSSDWFEYQFPASPAFFIGRTLLLKEIMDFACEVVRKTTSARGLLLTANSGWGKSSAVLASAAQLAAVGHFAVVIDCRSLSSSRSVLRVVEFALKKLAAEKGELFCSSVTNITGFEGASQALLTASEELRRQNRLAFIFWDQFENVFFLPEVLKRIRDLTLRCCDTQAQFVFGFAWKTDLIGATNEFPYQDRDALTAVSKKISVPPFSDTETTALLDKLRAELKTELRKDLRFLLSEFSQGFPWLLKKLCAHVKTQREAGVSQIDIANRLLNIQQLFKDDLSGLGAEEEHALRRIAKSAPVSISELSEDYSAKIVQSLVDRRLVVRIGSKFDIYWDIFRDYLNFDRVPVQENYLVRTPVATVLKSITALIKEGQPLEVAKFGRQMRFSEHSAMNVVRDLRLLGLATVDSGKLTAAIKAEGKAVQTQINQVRSHVRERLSQNRLVSRIIHELRTENSLGLDEIGRRLSSWCPYVTATEPTWREYARILASWMDVADLATYDSSKTTLIYYEPSTELRARDLQMSRNRAPKLLIPSVQYSPVETVAVGIAATFEGRRDFRSALKKSTAQKAFATLEILGMLDKTDGGYRVKTDFTTQMSDSQNRRDTFKVAALNLPAFRAFLGILDRYKQLGRSQHDLGLELRETLDLEWKDGTAKVNVKILLDWARHLGLAPGRFAGRPRKP